MGDSLVFQVNADRGLECSHLSANMLALEYVHWFSEMDEFTKLVSKLATAKGIVALLIVVMLLIFVYRNLDFITEISFKIDRPAPASVERQEEKETAQTSATSPESKPRSSPFINIHNAYLTPMRFEVPSALYFELTNAATYSGFETTISIDVGRARASAVDWIPKSSCESSPEAAEQPIVTILCPEIAAKETIYFQLLLSVPEVREIVIRSSGMTYPKELSSEDLFGEEESRDDEAFISPGMIAAFRVVFFLVALTFTIFFVVVIIAFLLSLGESKDESPKEE